MKLKHALARTLILTTFLSILPPHPAQKVVSRDARTIGDAPVENGLRFRLSEAASQVERPAQNTIAPAAPLSETETRTLLARLPPTKPDARVAEDFKLRERSLPPPRAGETIRAAFAVPNATTAPPTTTTTAPLEVSRFAPEGEVALAPNLSVTFSQPMVAVASQTEAARQVPVKLTPQSKGAWSWLGTQTLFFRADAEGGRLPMATNYTVTIPAGTKSALGNTLRETKTFTFATPAPTLKNSYPNGDSQPRDALMFIEFDQRIEAARVLERIRLESAGSTRLRLATPEEIAADGTIGNLVKQAGESRWLVFRAVNADGTTKDALPSDARINVRILSGTPSAEGSRTTIKEQSFAFKTYGALRVTETRCGYDKRCSPFDPFSILFSNQLDVESFQESQISISPEIPGAKINASYNSITIEGTKRGNTTYTVTIDRSVRDTFNQNLTGNNQLSFKVTTAEPSLFTTGQGFVVLDPAGRRAFNVYSVNYQRLRVRLYKVTPDDWRQFRGYQAALRQNNKFIKPPGEIVFDKIIDTNAKTDELIETAIDLSPALTNNFGQVFVEVEPVEDAATKSKQPVNRYNYRRNRIEAWVQSTAIGLDAFADKDALVVWANSLVDGSPLAGVDVRITTDDLSGTTNADGLARLAFKPGTKNGASRPPLLIARRGDDVAILPHGYYEYGGDSDVGRSWRQHDARETLRWYVFDDRKLYRPGEEVNVKGWVRKVNLIPTGDTEMFDAAGKTIDYVLKDSQSNDIAKGSARLNALAGFDLKLQLPETVNLGYTNLNLKLSDDPDEHTHNFQVQEFRRLEFEITARASEAPHFVGSYATATMIASYYAGGGLADTQVDWSVTSKPTNYTPPGRDDYTFGKFIAWWRDDGEDFEWKTEELKGRTGRGGQSHAAHGFRWS